MTAAAHDISARSRVRMLHPGDVAWGGAGDRFETLLGSCVAVVLADPRRSFGAMCHIVHARAPAGARQPSAAYTAGALASMYAMLRARGLNPSLCEAWVIGGGNLFPRLIAPGHVGDANVRSVLAALSDAGIRVLARDVGGSTYRRVGWTVGGGAPEVAAVQV